MTCESAGQPATAAVISARRCTVTALTRSSVIRFDEQRPQDEVGRLQGPALSDRSARSALLAERLEQHAVHRALDETRVEVHELARVPTAGDEALDQLVEQRDALALVGELVQAQNRVLVEASRVEGLDQVLTHVARDGQMQFLGPRRVLVESAVDAVDGRAEIEFDQRPEDDVLCIEVMKQRRLPDLHRVGDVTGGGTEIPTLSEQLRRRQQNPASRRRPVDDRRFPAMPVLHRSIVSPSPSATPDTGYRLVNIVRCQALSATPVMSLMTCLMVRYSSNE